MTPLGRTLIQIPGCIAGGKMLLAGSALGLGLEACVLAAMLHKPFPVIRTHSKPIETFSTSRRFALGCRSDSIAGYNAYVYWIRNRRREVMKRRTVDPSLSWYTHEHQWLREDVHLSLFALIEMVGYTLIIMIIIAMQL